MRDPIDVRAVRFRAATPADVPAIVALVESAYRGDASRAGWTTEADLLDGQRTDARGVADIVGKADGRVLLAESSSRLLACAQLERQGQAAYFGMFSVQPALQGGGIGRTVLAEAERIAREEWGCSEMRMTVISLRDELIAWYERRGYRRTGRHSPFPYGDERFGVPKRDDLRFELLVKPLVREERKDRTAKDTKHAKKTKVKREKA
jgi:ribosomal protein S18 acetylase RimI-like enzyme